MYVDLSWKIEEHWRYPLFERHFIKSHDAGDDWQITGFSLGTHWFTHMDFPRHMGKDLPDSECFPLEHYNGKASVIDLTGCSKDLRNYGFTRDDLVKAIGERKIEKIILLRSDWEKQVPHTEREFWNDAPYLTREATEYLGTLGLNAVGFDFPQDYAIRPNGTGRPTTPKEQFTHDVLLRHGTLLIEYAGNFDKIGDECELICLPLPIPHIDGCPVRLVAKI